MDTYIFYVELLVDSIENTPRTFMYHIMKQNERCIIQYPGCVTTAVTRATAEPMILIIAGIARTSYP